MSCYIDAWDRVKKLRDRAIALHSQNIGQSIAKRYVHRDRKIPDRASYAMREITYPASFEAHAMSYDAYTIVKVQYVLAYIWPAGKTMFSWWLIVKMDFSLEI